MRKENMENATKITKAIENRNKAEYKCDKYKEGEK